MALSASQGASDLEHEFLLMVFHAAAQSYRRHTVLQPLPLFLSDAAAHDSGAVGRRRQASVNVHDQVEALHNVSTRLIQGGHSSTSTQNHDDQQVDRVLDYLLQSAHVKVVSADVTGVLDAVHAAEVKYRQDMIHHGPEPQSQSGSSTSTPPAAWTKRPRHAFKVERRPEDNLAFQQLCHQHGQTMGFHGTSLENVYSILFGGFKGELNKTAVFGEGTYLTSDLDVALNFAKSSLTWKGCRLGGRVGCVFVCDVVKHPSVKFAGDVASNPQGTSLSGVVHVPDKYIVVKYDEHVRVSHVLIYVDDSHDRDTSTQLRSWMPVSGFTLMLFGYGLILVFAALLQNRPFRFWAKRLLLSWFGE